MLYVTTRSNTESVTAAKTLSQNRAGDGGLFVPFKLPMLTEAQIREFKHQSFSKTVADVLNLFFRSNLTAADIPEIPCNLRDVGRNTVVVELWKSVFYSYKALEKDIYLRLCAGLVAEREPTNWAKMAIRIAVIFGLFGRLDLGDQPDFAVNSGDFSLPTALWYCREMGFPIGKIICTTNENGGPWDLFTHGEMSCAASTLHTSLPELDVAVPCELERLLFHYDGLYASKEFTQAVEGRLHYKLDNDTLSQMNETFSVVVAGSGRVESIIHRIYRTNGYILDPYTALSFGGLQDYRSVAGESRPTVLLSDSCPLCYREQLAKALGTTEGKLTKLF